jgi:hypothetical protein
VPTYHNLSLGCFLPSPSVIVNSLVLFDATTEFPIWWLAFLLCSFGISTFRISAAKVTEIFVFYVLSVKKIAEEYREIGLTHFHLHSFSIHIFVIK